nr:collagen alpha-2(I) chain-like [Penaeus vannamei]
MGERGPGAGKGPFAQVSPQVKMACEGELPVAADRVGQGTQGWPDLGIPWTTQTACQQLTFSNSSDPGFVAFPGSRGGHRTPPSPVLDFTESGAAPPAPGDRADRPSADADPSNKRPNKGGSHSQGRKCAVLGRGDVLHKKGRFGRPDAGPLHETGEVHRPSRPTASSPTPSGAQGPPGALESPARHAPPTGAPREAFVARKAAASRLIERAAGREALGARRSRPRRSAVSIPPPRIHPAKGVMGSPPR